MDRSEPKHGYPILVAIATMPLGRHFRDLAPRGRRWSYAVQAQRDARALLAHVAEGAFG